MLRSLKALEGYTLRASDGDIGKVVDFLLDDEGWAIRYLVADTGGFLTGRLVLISPISFRRVDWSTQCFYLSLTKEKVENSPGIDARAPVSRQYEQRYFQYYNYPMYWGFTGLWGTSAVPIALANQTWQPVPVQPEPGASADVHLRSAKEVRGYHIQGSDDEIGHVEDYIVDDETWAIRYLVIDTRNWWFGKKVLVSPEWATRVSWEEHKVHVEMSRREIEQSPEWDPNAGVNREYEARLYDFYGRPVYWGDAPAEGLPPPSSPAESRPL